MLVVVCTQCWAVNDVPPPPHSPRIPLHRVSPPNLFYRVNHDVFGGSSAGAGVVYPPFLGVICIAYPKA